jgi:pyruvate dehydrogenase (quinone)/pyruvate oxidase
MANGLPYAIAAQLAYPERQVVAFVGDGGFSMLMGEFATCVKYQLPIKIVIVKNNTLGMIKWEQMVFLGNPEYGVDLAPVDFVKAAEAFGLAAVRIDEPKKCRKQLAEALALPGPALIECVVDPHEPPLPPKITREQTKHLAKALARGEEWRTRIGLTIGRDMIDETTFEASPYGVVGRVAKKLGGKGGDENE